MRLRRVARGHAVVDDPDPLGVGAELGHHLVGHELRRRVHPGALRPRPGGRGGGNRAWRRSHNSGKRTAVRSWTVTTRAARRVGGTTKLVPCTTSIGPGEPLDGRDAAVGPGQVQRPGRHGPLAHLDAGGDERRQAAAPPPGHGEGGDVEVGHAAKGPQGTLAERPTPVRVPSSGVASTATRRRSLSDRAAPAPGEPCTPGPGPRALSRPLAWRRDHRPRRRSGCRPPAARPGPRRRARPTVTAVVNTGDDTVLHGLHISPDLDTVTYTLAGMNDDERGWGLAGRDLDRDGDASSAWAARPGSASATAIWPPTSTAPSGWPRAPRCREVTAEITAALGVGRPAPPHVRRPGPDPAHTRRRARDRLPGVLRRRASHAVAVRRCASTAPRALHPPPACSTPSPAPRSSWSAPRTRSCRSVRSWPCPGIADALAARRREVVAVSPIVAGAALKGPADRLMTELGHEASVVGVARIYAELVGTLVIDEADAALAAAVEAAGSLRGGPHRHAHRRPRRRAGLAPSSTPATARARPPAPDDDHGRDPTPRRRPPAPGTLTRDPGHRDRRDRPGRRSGRLIAALVDLADGDVVVVTQKIVSKAEGRMVAVDPDDPDDRRRASIEPSRCGSCAGGATSSSPRPATASSAPTPGSTSPTSSAGWAALLPEDSDRSARRIRDGLRAATGHDVGVIVSDTFGRAWRKGVDRRRHRLRRRRRRRRPPGHRRRPRSRAPGHRGLRGRRDRLGGRARHGQGQLGSRWPSSVASTPAWLATGFGGRGDRPAARPRTCSADFTPAVSAPGGRPDGSTVSERAWRRREVENPVHARVELGPRPPAQVDRRRVRGRGRCAGARRAAPGRARGRWSTRPRSAMTRASSLTESSRPVPTLSTRPPPRVGGPDEGVDDVVDEDEVARLLAVAEDRHRLPPQQPVGEDGHHAGLAVGILAGPVDVGQRQGAELDARAARGRRRDSRWPPSSTPRRATGAGGGATPARGGRTDRGSP